ncbi:MAG: hypothetical protein Q9225_003508 [Loekoesia sp. 1 TL-2023]
MVPVEPVSLPVGAIALASVFTTCVECFEYIDAFKACGRDMDILSTKFRIEKTRFLIWGDSVGLLPNGDSSPTTKLESPLCRPIVEETLNSIRLLFTDTKDLTDRYGLKCADEDDSSAYCGSSRGSNMPFGLKASHNRFKTRIEANQKQIGTARKVRWAMHDKKKFACLVEDIRQLIDGLQAITESQAIAIKRKAMIREELDSIEDLEELSLIVEASAGGNEEWSDAASTKLGASTSRDKYDDRISDRMSTESGVPWPENFGEAHEDPIDPVLAEHLLECAAFSKEIRRLQTREELFEYIQKEGALKQRGNLLKEFRTQSAIGNVSAEAATHVLGLIYMTQEKYLEILFHLIPTSKDFLFQFERCSPKIRIPRKLQPADADKDTFDSDSLSDSDSSHDWAPTLIV